jgi:hypothetical protein
MTTGSRRVRAATLAMVLVAGQACYTYAPVVAPTAAPGARISMRVTDAGRVALGANLGEGVRQVEGVVESVSDTAYVLRMRSASYISGTTMTWSDERLVVGRGHVTDVRERRFSRTRTALAAAAAIGGAVVFVATRSLLGSGSERDGGTDGGEQPGS